MNKSLKDQLEQLRKGKKLPIGTKRKHGGKDVIKTAQGWKPVSQPKYPSSIEKLLRGESTKIQGSTYRWNRKTKELQTLHRSPFDEDNEESWIHSGHASTKQEVVKLLQGEIEATIEDEQTRHSVGAAATIDPTRRPVPPPTPAQPSGDPDPNKGQPGEFDEEMDKRKKEQEETTPKKIKYGVKFLTNSSQLINFENDEHLDNALAIIDLYGQGKFEADKNKINMLKRIVEGRYYPTRALQPDLNDPYDLKNEERKLTTIVEKLTSRGRSKEVSRVKKRLDDVKQRIKEQDTKKSHKGNTMRTLKDQLEQLRKGKVLPIGTKRKHGKLEVIKTADGWKPVKGEGKQESAPTSQASRKYSQAKKEYDDIMDKFKETNNMLNTVKKDNPNNKKKISQLQDDVDNLRYRSKKAYKLMEAWRAKKK